MVNQTCKTLDLPKELVSNLGNGHGLYSVDLNEVMSGTTPNKGTQATLNDNINTFLLWNDAGQSVNFKADNNRA